ncbi:MAG TPA: class I SAM-dependent methyltransferase [Puia sp.]|nr:class I SAM-dependent methyltransferase [Puia sp.]
MAKDLFSGQAALYAKYRPSYPAALIDYVLSFVKGKRTAWDCATGNGQAALLYADYFEKVFATDISEKQIAEAPPHPKIIYCLCEAEKTLFPDNSFDLITVAQAYHWFQFDAFLKEVKRVARNNCVIAVWGYGLAIALDEKIQELVQHFYIDVVGKYWDAERRYVDEKYATLPFGFNSLPSREFRIDVQWDAEELLGYFNTWSSVQHFIRANGYNPVDEITDKIKLKWEDGQKKSFYFPIFLLIGRIQQ